MKTTYKLIPMVDYILNIDWMTTNEFCNAYGVPHPIFTGNVRTSADQFLQVDAVKHRMFVEYAKILDKKITATLLMNNMGFQSLDVRGGRPTYKNGKYKIFKDEYGFRLEPYDSVDGYRIHKVVDLVKLDLSYNN